MGNKIEHWLDNGFKALGFKKQKNIFNENDFKADYRSADLLITIEIYRVELYVSMAKVDTPDDMINLFNLLSFLNRNKGNQIQSKYYKDVSNPNESLLKQVVYNLDVIKENLSAIEHFFCDPGYNKRIVMLRNYIVEQNPGLFKTM